MRTFAPAASQPAPDPRAALAQTFGFAAFRDGQEPVIAALLAGRSALAVFPTGSGKSLCYQLPALLLPHVTIVVSPLIALMKDQIDFLVGKGIRAARLDSTLTLEESQTVQRDMENNHLQILYVSPERFNNERFLGLLRRIRISLFAIDEAHCISEWGHNFRPDYLKLADTARSIGVERVLCLTATATPAVQRDICAAFAIAPADAIVTGFYRPNLRLATTPVSATRRDDLLLARLQKRPPGATVVYVTLQKTAESLAALLQNNGLTAWAYHAGMESDDRNRVQDEWMASGSGIVVATIAFGMGIDKADVRYVYHYNLPKSLESYSQEIGRAGRDGQPAIVELLACPDDVPTLENFAYGDTPTVAALYSLAEDLLARGNLFDVSLYELGQLHDLRPLVLRTALTYLELAQVIRQGTPFYAAYEFRTIGAHTPQSIAATFEGPAAQTVVDVFRIAKMGRSWHKLNPDDAAVTLNLSRKRIVRVLEVLEERGFIELKVAEARQTYERIEITVDTDALARDLHDKFARRESGEIARLRQVLDLVTHNGCQVNALIAHFGETRADPCGHCTFCATGQPAVLPTPVYAFAPPDDAQHADLQSVRSAHPALLADARTVARFLCGLTSPAFTRARFTKHALFGAWANAPFGEVLAWAETL